MLRHRDRRETLPCVKRRPPLCGCPGAPGQSRQVKLMSSRSLGSSPAMGSHEVVERFRRYRRGE